MPSFTLTARRRRWKLQGIVSVHVLATPIIGRFRSSSVKPIPLSIARAPARSRPSVIMWLRYLGLSVIVISDHNILITDPLIFKSSLQGQHGHVILLLPSVAGKASKFAQQEVDERCSIGMLLEQCLQAGKAEHLTLGVMSLYQAITVEEYAFIK